MQAGELLVGVERAHVLAYERVAGEHLRAGRTGVVGGGVGVRLAVLAQRVHLVEAGAAQRTLVVLAGAVRLHVAGECRVVHQAAAADGAGERLAGVVAMTQHVARQPVGDAERLPAPAALERLARQRRARVRPRVLGRMLDQLLLAREHAQAQRALVDLDERHAAAAAVADAADVAAVAAAVTAIAGFCNAWQSDGGDVNTQQTTILLWSSKKYSTIHTFSLVISWKSSYRSMNSSSI